MGFDYPHVHSPATQERDNINFPNKAGIPNFPSQWTPLMSSLPKKAQPFKKKHTWISAPSSSFPSLFFFLKYINWRDITMENPIVFCRVNNIKNASFSMAILVCRSVALSCPASSSFEDYLNSPSTWAWWLTWRHMTHRFVELPDPPWRWCDPPGETRRGNFQTSGVEYLPLLWS